MAEENWFPDQRTAYDAGRAEAMAEMASKVPAAVERALMYRFGLDVASQACAAAKACFAKEVDRT
jgi:hypothetical protein